MEDKEEICFEDLYWAYCCCNRNKRNTDAAVKFAPVHARQVWKLIEEVRERKYRLSPFRAFIVDYPTVREVFCAAYRDRVMTWFVVNELNPLIERHLVYDCSNCRKNKGTDFAIRRVRHFIRRESVNYRHDVFALKVDISGFFMSINRQLLLDMMLDLIEREYTGKYPRTLSYLCSVLITSDVTQNCIYCCDRRKWENLPARKTLFGNSNGLPIGSLFSQIFCNYYLSGLDHYIKHDLGARNYSRYVDDMVLIDRDRKKLEVWFAAIRQYISRYGLKLNEGKCSIRSCRYGIAYLGKVIYPHHAVMQKRCIRKMIADSGRFRTAREAYVHLACRKGALRDYCGYSLGRSIYDSLPERFRKEMGYSHKHYFVWTGRKYDIAGDKGAVSATGRR